MAVAALAAVDCGEVVVTFFAAFAAWECTFVACSIAIALTIEAIAGEVVAALERRATRPAPLPRARLL